MFSGLLRCEKAIQIRQARDNSPSTAQVRMREVGCHKQPIRAQGYELKRENRVGDEISAWLWSYGLRESK
jgi:hypothetical protein